ncbi:MAG: signal peptidase I [bacterium]|nr:signal peptidase I [bacterium]
MHPSERPSSAKHAPSRAAAAWHTFWQMLIIIPVALFVKSNTIELFKIPTGSMEPTLYGANDMGRGFGDHLLVSRFTYGLSGVMKIPLLNWRIPLPYRRLMFWGMRQPRVGDVVVFENPVDPRIDYIKRCAGTPGDRVAIRQGRLYVNGELITNSPATATYVRYVNAGLLADRYAPLSRAVAKLGEIYCARVLATNAALARDALAIVQRDYPQVTLTDLKRLLLDPNQLVRDRLRPPALNEFLRLVERHGGAEAASHVSVNGRPFLTVASEVERRVAPFDPLLDTLDVTLTVPSNCFFMLGDNSAASLDSRYWGFVPFELIKGKALCVYLPIKRVRVVR